MNQLIIRPATEQDIALILHFVRELAIYEKAEDEAKATPEHIRRTVQEWDARYMVQEIERSVGRDLQFIRINGTVVGALAGLVSITAEPATPSAVQAVLVGAVGGVLVVFSILMLERLRIDDPVGAISVHGAAGIWGLLAVPLTNTSASLSVQMLGAACIFAWVFVASLVVWGLIQLLMGLRVSEEDEYEGVDIAECGLEAYPEFTRK